ncbi:MAG: LysM peptidoglycan-binding domain-containing protein [Paracoccaceae bacterium]
MSRAGPILAAGAALALALGGVSAARADEMRSITSGFLASIGQEPETPRADAEALGRLVNAATGERRSDAYLDAIVNEAVASGAITVPEAMRTTEGAVDTRTLLAALVARSATDDPKAWTEGVDLSAFREGLEASAASMAAQASPEETAAERRHTVVAGESLAALALRYYGEASAYPRIFEANRDRLGSPDRIQVGQRLVIPR